MKIGIITFHAALNYGAVLQAYALSTFLKSLGHQPSVIRYCPSDTLSGVVRSRFGVYGLHPSDYVNSYRRRSFASFRSKHLPETDRIFRTEEELSQQEPFDAYICGSDQIWNSELTENVLDTAYFLSFVRSGALRIAYAASTGGSGFADEVQAAELLGNMDRISVREAALVPAAERLSGKKVVPVLDPTLLPIDYSELFSKPRKRYILLYALQESATVYNRARLLSRMTGLPILNLGARVNPWKHPGRQYCASPQGFVSLFRYADYVVTNSFHGTVFASIFSRPLFSCALEGERKTRNVRMVGFLSAIGLSERFYEPERKLDAADLEAARNTDWDAVGVKLEGLRSSSVEFLKNSLNKV